jgi:predicted RecB family nuclease
MPTVLTKHYWLAAQQCLGMAWHQLRADPVPPDEAALFRMQQGREVGELARKLYPAGVLIAGSDNQAAATRTQACLTNPNYQTIFEATALAAPFIAKADILTLAADGWHVIEVKSRFSGAKDLIDDLAYTVMVFRRFGVTVRKASLLLLSREYRYGDSPNQLFDSIDVTKEALARAAEFDASAGSCARALFHYDPPDPKLGPACRDCAEFGTECLGAKLAHTTLEIPGLHWKKLQRLAAGDIVDLADLPEDLNLNSRQQRAVQSVRDGRLVVEPDLRDALNSIAWPCYYLDFETVQTTLPLYPSHGCHEQILTQFSIHKRDRPGTTLLHVDYLADSARDCQRQLAEHLIEHLGQQGSIIVYSNFEQTRIKALQDRFPDLSTPLQAILDRLVDLLPIIANHVYHPDFHGSFSIKKVLPALVSEMSYDDLDIRNGDSAVARFARMARGEITGPDVDTTRAQLLRYCERDTLAMVRLHDRLLDLAAPLLHHAE